MTPEDVNFEKNWPVDLEDYYILDLK